MGSLNKKDLLAKQKPAMEKVSINKEDFVFVKEMTAKERNWYESQIISYEMDEDMKPQVKQDLKDFKGKLALCTICDEKGSLLFKDTDLALINNLSGNFIEEVVEVAQRLNKMSAEQLETEVKNSEAAQDGGSSSGSVLL